MSIDLKIKDVTVREMLENVELYNEFWLTEFMLSDDDVFFVQDEQERIVFTITPFANPIHVNATLSDTLEELESKVSNKMTFSAMIVKNTKTV